jgi:hypothetical protein
MDCDSDCNSDDADPDNHPCVMAFKRTFHFVRDPLLIGKVFGGVWV